MKYVRFVRSVNYIQMKNISHLSYSFDISAISNIDINNYICLTGNAAMHLCTILVLVPLPGNLLAGGSAVEVTTAIAAWYFESISGYI